MSVAAEVEESVARRYEIKRRLGKGAYGIVWKAIERRSGQTVAVKKIFDAFRNRTDAQQPLLQPRPCLALSRDFTARRDPVAPGGPIAPFSFLLLLTFLKKVL